MENPIRHEYAMIPPHGFAGRKIEGPAQDIPDGSILMIHSKERPEGWFRPLDLEMQLEFQSRADPFYDFTGARGHYEQTGAASGLHGPWSHS